MIHEKVRELDRLAFYLSSRKLTRASSICAEALKVLERVATWSKSGDAEYSGLISALEESVSSLRKCASTCKIGDERACVNEAKRVYRHSMILFLTVTGRIRELVRARKAAYASIAMGLPTAALFGLSPMGAALIFVGVVWTYFYFIRLKLAGWVVLVVTLALLTPFTVNATLYFSQAVFNEAEVIHVAETLGVGSDIALALMLILFCVSTASLALAVYALFKLVQYRAVFA